MARDFFGEGVEYSRASTRITVYCLEWDRKIVLVQMTCEYILSHSTSDHLRAEKTLLIVFCERHIGISFLLLEKC